MFPFFVFFFCEVKDKGACVCQIGSILISLSLIFVYKAIEIFPCQSGASTVMNAAFDGDGKNCSFSVRENVRSRWQVMSLTETNLK